jgi:hypothetical protein
MRFSYKYMGQGLTTCCAKRTNPNTHFSGIAIANPTPNKGYSDIEREYTLKAPKLLFSSPVFAVRECVNRTTSVKGLIFQVNLQDCYAAPTVEACLQRFMQDLASCGIDNREIKVYSSG